jgi:hypothetical protein
MSINLQLGVDGRLHKTGKRRERRGWDDCFHDEPVGNRETVIAWAKEIAATVALFAGAVAFCWLCFAAGYSWN